MVVSIPNIFYTQGALYIEHYGMNEVSKPLVIGLVIDVVSQINSLPTSLLYTHLFEAHCVPDPVLMQRGQFNKVGVFVML